MKTIIIVYTLAMVQGFLDAEVQRWECVTEIKQIFDKLYINSELSLMATWIKEKCKDDIRMSIESVRWRIQQSKGGEIHCLGMLKERLGEIRTSYEAELDSYDDQLDNTDIGLRLEGCFRSIGKCIKKASKCADILSCDEECNKIFYEDGTTTYYQIGTFLGNYVSIIANESLAFISDLNKIGDGIQSCGS